MMRSSRQTGHLAPDRRGVVVFGVDGDQQPVLRQAEVARDQLPGVGDRLLLEVVAEAEIAQHLEEGVVPRGVADIVQIVVLAAGADAFLRRGGAHIGPLLLAGEHVLELHHAGVGEHQRRIVARHQRRAFAPPRARCGRSSRGRRRGCRCCWPWRSDGFPDWQKQRTGGSAGAGRRVIRATPRPGWPGMIQKEESHTPSFTKCTQSSTEVGRSERLRETLCALGGTLCMTCLPCRQLPVRNLGTKLMPASLSAAQIAQYQRDGFLFPVDCLTPEEVAPFPRPPRGLRARAGRHLRQTARPGALQVASAVHLDGRTGAPSEGARRGGKHHRAEHPDLSPDLLAEGAARSGACLLASGRHLFRPGAGRADHRLDRADRTPRRRWAASGSCRAAT